MSSSVDTANYIVDQIGGSARVRKMFGDYALYYEDKVIGLICDDQLFIKYTDKGKVFAKGKYVEGIAYPGAKPSMNITEYLDDSAFLRELSSITANSLPLPRSRRGSY